MQKTWNGQMYLKGEELTDSQKSLVFEAFPVRWTQENPRRWEGASYYINTKEPPPTDEEWLKTSAFTFNAEGTEVVESIRWPARYVG